jgi:hypothetical protein
MHRIVLGICLVLTLCVFLGNPLIATAQNTGTLEESDIILTVSPEIPGAQQRVTISLESYVTDLNRAHISWQKDGKQDLLGYGKKQFSFTTGNIGQSTVVTVNIRVESGEIINRRVVVNPAEINLLWEGADSYTPPFYRGRALPGPEGTVRIIAIPQIQQNKTLLSPEDYTFTWKKQDRIIQASSGYGKNAFTFTKDYLNPSEMIEVIGQNNKTGARATGKISVQAFKPKILFYEKNSLLGIRQQQALQNGYTVGDSDKTIIALPYFISPQNNMSKELVYEWKINDRFVPTPAIKNILTLRKGTQKGVAAIEVTITSLKKLFLEEKARLSISLE